MRWLLCLVAWLLSSVSARALDIYFIDTEGGAATLIVTPAGESILIDCGNPGPRDAERIHKAATELAGLKQLDHLIITHWHSDHYGGAGRLAKLLPIANFHDRGIPDKLSEDGQFVLRIADYKEASKGKSNTLKPGDVLKFTQKPGTPELKLLCVCASGEVIADRPGAPENPLAKEHKDKAVDKSDNAKSLGFVLSYGDFRFLDLGDLTHNIEYKLIHPTDKLGPIDVYQVTHHGLDISNNPVLIRTVKPTVAVYNNGAKKGCAPAVTSALRRVKELKAIYQMHRNVTVGAAENTDPEFIANPDEKCQGESIRLKVADDGKSYALTVGGKGKPRRYETRSK